MKKNTTWVFRFQKYGKFWSISLSHFIKHNPLISEECVVSMYTITTIHLLINAEVCSWKIIFSRKGEVKSHVFFRGNEHNFLAVFVQSSARFFLILVLLRSKWQGDVLLLHCVTQGNEQDKRWTLIYILNTH